MSSERIRRGWHDAADMTTDYEWNRLLPVASDQKHYHYEIESPSGFFNEVDAIIDDTLDGSIGEIGGWNGPLHLAVVTPGMIQVLRDHIWTTDGRNEQITIVHYVVTRGWLCLQGWGRLRAARPGDIANPQPASGVIRNFRIDFDTVGGLSGGIAPSGGSHSLAHNVSHNIGGIPE